MSEFYAVINNEVSGPHSIAEINAFSVDGHIHGDSAVRRVTDEDWGTWRDFLAAGANTESRSGSLVMPAASTKPTLAKLRSETFYGLTRALLFSPFIVNLIAALVIWYFFLTTASDSEDPFVRASRMSYFVVSIASSISTLALLIVALVGRAVLDFSDCELRRSTVE